MASLANYKDRWYARSSSTINGKRKQFLTPLMNRDEDYISKKMAKIRLAKYENSYELEAIEMKKIGKKMTNIDWFDGKEVFQYESIIATMSEAVTDWINTLKADKLSKSTISIYERHLTEFMTTKGIGRKLLVKNLTTSHVDSFKQTQKKIALATLHSKLRSIENFLRWAVKRQKTYGLTQNDKPCIDKPKLVVKKPLYITNDMFNRVLIIIDKKYIGDPEKADYLNKVFHLYRNTGLRLREPFRNNLESDCLKIKAGRTKNSYERPVYLTEDQVQTVKRMKETVQEGIKRGKNRRNMENYISRIFKSALVSLAETGYKFHCLRDTFATRLYYETGDIYKVCGHLGHADITMTTKYTHFDERELEKAFPDIAKYHRENAQNRQKSIRKEYTGNNSILNSAPKNVVYRG